jgi:mono/diheme cytochrome c family protein
VSEEREAGVSGGRVGLVLVACGVLWLAVVTRAVQEAHPPQPHRHPAAQALVNPVPRTDTSIAAGRAIYNRHCVRCHGPRGKGDGGGAGGGGIPSDLTDEVWDHGSSDGEVFVVLRDGTSVDMEGYGERLNETELWHLVNYVKGLGPAPAR